MCLCAVWKKKPSTKLPDEAMCTADMWFFLVFLDEKCCHAWWILVFRFVKLCIAKDDLPNRNSSCVYSDYDMYTYVDLDIL